MESDFTVIMCALFLRAIQGAASATINTSCFAMAANKYPEQTEFMVGALEATSGAGLIVGFSGGSYMFSKLGYEMTYFVFGGLLPVVAILARVAFKLIEMEEEHEDPLTYPLLAQDESDDNR